MEARVQQFQTDSAAAAAAAGAAGSPPAKVVKEIATLRRFLHRNQTHRFSDKEQTYLFQAVGNYVAAGRQDGEDSSAVPLIEDALKMPFTVFTTAHKKKFLKMLEKCTGVVPSALHLSGEGSSTAEEAGETVLQVIDLDESIVVVMEEDSGETYELSLQDQDSETITQVRESFETAEDAIVLVVLSTDKKKIMRLGSN